MRYLELSSMPTKSNSCFFPPFARNQQSNYLLASYPSPAASGLWPLSLSLCPSQSAICGAPWFSAASCAACECMCSSTLHSLKTGYSFLPPGMPTCSCLILKLSWPFLKAASSWKPSACLTHQSVWAVAWLPPDLWLHHFCVSWKIGLNSLLHHQCLEHTFPAPHMQLALQKGTCISSWP